MLHRLKSHQFRSHESGGCNPLPCSASPKTIFAVCAVTMSCCKKGTGPLACRLVFEKLSHNVCNILVFTYCHKIMEPVITIAITAHWTPTITSCNGSSWLNVRFSQDQYLLFWESTPPLRWHQTSSPNRTCFQSLSPAYNPWRYQFTKFSSCKKCTWHMQNTCTIKIFQWVIHCE